MGNLASKKNPNKDRDFKREHKQHDTVVYKTMKLARIALTTNHYGDALILFSQALAEAKDFRDYLLRRNITDHNLTDWEETIESLTDTINRTYAKIMDEEEELEDQKPSFQPRDLPPFQGQGYTDEELELVTRRVYSMVVRTQKQVSWSDVIGCDEARNAFKSIIESFFDDKIQYLYDSGVLERANGIILYGPPGTGKTLMTHAAVSALQEKLAVFRITQASISSKYVGETEKILAALFDYANACAPSMIFIDEADVLFGKRNSKTSEHSLGIINCLLQYMSDSKDVLFIATTNRPSAFDTPFRRRFEKLIYVGLLKEHERKDLIKFYLKGKLHHILKMDVTQLAKVTENYSGSDIKNLIKFAHDLARKQSLASTHVKAEGTCYYPCSPKASNAITMKEASKKFRCKKFVLVPITVEMIKTALDHVPSTADMKEIEELEEFKEQHLTI